MDFQALYNVASVLGIVIAIYLGLRKAPGEIQRNDAATINDLSSANSTTVATNAVLQDRIEKLQQRLDDLEALIDKKDRRIAELEGLSAVQNDKIVSQSRRITEQAGRIKELQAEIDELRQTQNGYINGHSKDLSS